jgi:urease accessory protein
MIVLTQIIAHNSADPVDYTLALTAEERTRSRLRYESEEGEMLQLQLTRGTVLHDGDLLATELGDKFVKVIAKPESIITVTAHSELDLLRAAYHLGNRHVPLEVKPEYLRLSPDPVLEDMLHHLGLKITQETAPFQPESGAYGHSH